MRNGPMLVTAVEQVMDEMTDRELRDAVANAVEHEPGWPSKPGMVSEADWQSICLAAATGKVLCGLIASTGKELLMKRGEPV